MKKGLLISLITIVLVILIIILSIFGFKALNKPKTVINAETFKNLLENKGYSITRLSETQNIYAAKKDGNSINFYEFSDTRNAKMLFERIKKSILNKKGNSSSSSSKNFSNFSSYSLTSNGSYNYVSTIDNTLIHINAKDEYKKEMKAILKEINY